MNSYEQKNLTTRDLITLAVFTVLFTLISAIVNIIGAIPVLHPFATGISMIPCGIVWMYLRVKVPKKGSVIIQVSVMSLMILLLGGIWWLLLGMAIGGVFVELITQVQKKDFKKITIGYIVFGLFSTAVANLPPLIARDYYYASSVRNMDSKVVTEIIDFMTIPVVIISLAVSIIGSLVGAFLGRKMLKKHFERAGIN